MPYLYYGLAAALISIALTPLVRRFAIGAGAIDVPRLPRNLHQRPVPKLGGLAVYLAFAVLVLLYVVFGNIDPNIVPFRFIWSLLIGGGVLMVGGFLDDKYDLPPKLLWVFPALASLIVIYAGIGVGITLISNPFGNPFNLKFAVLGVPASAIFVFLWLNGMMYTTKFLDGLDGLVAGIGTISALSMFALSLTAKVNQPITASLAIILAGALAGYLIYAFHPASIFFGEGGSTFVGFALGVLAIILGAKIATALLVMGIPILDVAWVIAQRLWNHHSPFVGDRLHIHFKLLDLGFSQRQTALVLYAISAVFGFTAVFLQSRGKLVALIILFILMVALIGLVLRAYKRMQQQN